MPKRQRVQDILRRVQGIPSVQAAFASNFVPLGSGGGGGSIVVDGKTYPRGEEPRISFIGTTPLFRQTLNVPLVSGRDFTETEEATRTPVAVVNQTMASQLWPKEEALGKRFRFSAGDLQDWFQVVGVVADFRHGQGTNNRPVSPSAYVPYAFQPTLNTGLTVRVSGESAPRRGRGARADPAVGSVAAGLRDLADGGAAPAQLLALPDLRLDVLVVRRRRAAARVDRRLRRAGVFGVAADAGDRRARRARRRAPRRAAHDRGSGAAARGDWHRRRSRRRARRRRG